MSKPDLIGQITTLVNEPIRDQIAGVCIHWAILELSIERVKANLEGQKINIECSTADLCHKIDALKDQARDKLPLEAATELTDICSKILDLRHDRHRVVHGLWAMDPSGNLLSVFPTTKKGKVTAPLSAADVRKIKKRICAEIVRLEKFFPDQDYIGLPLKPKRGKRSRPSQPAHPPGNRP